MDSNGFSPAARVMLGLAGLAIGVGVIASAVSTLRATSHPAVSDGVPGVAAGIGFVMGGAWVLAPKSAEQLRALLKALAVTSFAVILHWIAFVPGARDFTMGLTPGRTPQPVPSVDPGEGLGRLIFAVGSIAVDVVTLKLWFGGFQRLRQRRRSRATPERKPGTLGGMHGDTDQ